jgi:hypothetical protein
MANISDQIQQIQIVPKRLEDFSQVERDNFPSIFDICTFYDIMDGYISSLIIQYEVTDWV